MCIYKTFQWAGCKSSDSCKQKTRFRTATALPGFGSGGSVVRAWEVLRLLGGSSGWKLRLNSPGQRGAKPAHRIVFSRSHPLPLGFLTVSTPSQDVGHSAPRLGLQRVWFSCSQMPSSRQD